jgi:tRNA (guanine-N7-)-methyltransferase
VLRPGGELHIASDVEDYFGLIKALVSGHARFHEQSVAEPKNPEHSLDYLTNFERKYRIEGRSIFRAGYVLV